MCAAHRRQVLDSARQALKQGQPCRLISTSLIEAGVDVSFPLVLRAEAGLDSIAQAAGRCNREGRWRTEDSEVLVFATDPKWTPPAELKQFAAVATQVLHRHVNDPLSPDAIRDYFEELYWARGKRELDQHDLLGHLAASRLDSLPMDTLALKYRLIDTAQESVIVPFDDRAKDSLRDLIFAGGVRGPARALQPYTVQVPRKVVAALKKAGAIAPVAPERLGEQFMQLVNAELYRNDIGLHWEHPEFLGAASLVI
jgi:CRISPR-associated endonuclease/helicase Cas3